MISEPKWLTVGMVVAIQEESIVMFGGLAGIRDVGLLESAVARPKHLYVYQEDSSIFDLATSLCVAIIRNHPFLDGNKRAGLLSARAFLFLNDYVFEPLEVDEVEIILAVADGTVDEVELCKWFESYSSKEE